MAGFTEISGITSESDIVEYREGPDAHGRLDAEAPPEPGDEVDQVLLVRRME